MKADDVDISLHENVLTIQGEKRLENEEKDQHSYHMERSFGSFARAVRLPGEVGAGKIDASLKDGLLTIKLPKSQKAQQESKLIPIKAG